MGIAVAGQKAYSIFGDEATLTEEFLSKDYRTWEGGLISTNHENTNDLLGGASLYDLEYDTEKKLVIASFGNLPDTAKKFIESEFYQGLSQECIPIRFNSKSKTTEVIRGYGTGVTLVMWPHQPAASPEMGVGVRPSLAAIVSQKYPSNPIQKIESQIEDSMVEKTGDGKPVVSIEAFESTVSENVKLQSKISTLESRNKELENELASSKQKYAELESGEADRTKIAVESALESFKIDLKAAGERETAVSELKTVMTEEAAKSYLATNPTLDQIKSIAAILKTSASKGVGSSMGSTIDPSEQAEIEAEKRWESSNVRL
jgi:hypothetical protein